MLIAFLLHAYQPPQQNASVFSDIAKQCYLPLIKLAKSKKDFNFTLNIPLSTLEWFEKEKMESFFYDVKSLYEVGRVEFTGCGAYHPILTKISTDEACRQIVLNEAGLSYYLGRREGFEGEPSLMIKNVKGFFPPEMGFNSAVAGVLQELAYEWVILDEVHKAGGDCRATARNDGNVIPANLPVIASETSSLRGVQQRSNLEEDRHASLAMTEGILASHNDGDANHINKISGTDVFAVFRNRPLSVALSYNRTSDPAEFLEGLKHLESLGAKYAIIALDAETFGHHNKQGIELLGNIIDECVFSGYKFATLSDLVDEYKTKKSIEINEASWGASDADVASGNLYPVWYVAGNGYHEAFSNLEKLAIEMVANGGESLVGKEALFGNLPVWDFNKVSLAAELSEEEKSYIKARILVDKSLNSDKFWWSSKHPYFDVNMIKRSLELFIKSYEKSGKKDETVVVEIKKERDKILSLLKSE